MSLSWYFEFQICIGSVLELLIEMILWYWYFYTVNSKLYWTTLLKDCGKGKWVSHNFLYCCNSQLYLSTAFLESIFQLYFSNVFVNCISQLYLLLYFPNLFLYFSTAFPNWNFPANFPAHLLRVVLREWRSSRSSRQRTGDSSGQENCQ